MFVLKKWNEKRVEKNGKKIIIKEEIILCLSQMGVGQAFSGLWIFYIIMRQSQGNWLVKSRAVSLLEVWFRLLARLLSVLSLVSSGSPIWRRLCKIWCITEPHVRWLVMSGECSFGMIVGGALVLWFFIILQ